MNRNIYFLLISLIPTVYFACSSPIKETANPALTLWYQSPAQKWTNTLLLGNGRLGAMVYGGIDTAHFKLNEESLWAGGQGNPIAVKRYQQNILQGDLAGAHDFGIEQLTTKPTSFRSYEPLGDLFIDFSNQGMVTNYRRALDI